MTKDIENILNVTYPHALSYDAVTIIYHSRLRLIFYGTYVLFSISSHYHHLHRVIYKASHIRILYQWISKRVNFWLKFSVESLILYLIEIMGGTYLPFFAVSRHSPKLRSSFACESPVCAATSRNRTSKKVFKLMKKAYPLGIFSYLGLEFMIN